MFMDIEYCHLFWTSTKRKLNIKDFISLLYGFSCSTSTWEEMATHPINCAKQSCPSHDWGCNHPIYMGKLRFISVGAIWVCLIFRKTVKTTQTHFSGSWLCLERKKSGGIMFLCYVKAINGEIYTHSFLRKQLKTLQKVLRTCSVFI